MFNIVQVEGSDSSKDLGFTFYSQLTLVKHINDKIIKACGFLCAKGHFTYHSRDAFVANINCYFDHF